MERIVEIEPNPFLRLRHRK